MEAVASGFEAFAGHAPEGAARTAELVASVPDAQARVTATASRAPSPEQAPPARWRLALRTFARGFRSDGTDTWI